MERTVKDDIYEIRNMRNRDTLRPEPSKDCEALQYN